MEPPHPGGGKLRLKAGFQSRIVGEHAFRQVGQHVPFDLLGALKQLEQESPGQERIVARGFQQRDRQIARRLSGGHPDGTGAKQFHLRLRLHTGGEGSGRKSALACEPPQPHTSTGNRRATKLRGHSMNHYLSGSKSAFDAAPSVYFHKKASQLLGASHTFLLIDSATGTICYVPFEIPTAVNRPFFTAPGALPGKNWE